MKYQWKHGDDTPMELEESIEASKIVLEKEFNDFFKIMFDTIFHHSYIFNYIVENYDNIKELQSLNFKNNVEYRVFLESLCKKCKIDSIEQKEKSFYKKASRKILSQVFILNNNDIENSYSTQKHIFYISGIKLKKFQYKLAPDITMRNPKVNEIRISASHWDADYDKENCVIEYSYKYKDFGEVIHNQHIIPLALKLAFKNCARIKKINNYLETGDDGESIQQLQKENYYGNIPVSVPDELISELPKLIKLCTYYTKNAEKDFDNIGFLSVALDFYSQALDKIHPTHKIAYACLALEAMYNTTSDKVIHQITERCSFLLNPILHHQQNRIKK